MGISDREVVFIIYCYFALLLMRKMCTPDLRQRLDLLLTRRPVFWCFVNAILYIYGQMCGLVVTTCIHRHREADSSSTLV